MVIISQPGAEGDGPRPVAGETGLAGDGLGLVEGDGGAYRFA